MYNKLIEKPKLNIFQKIRKNFLIIGLNGKKYAKAPEYLKNDQEVIDKLISKSLINIRYVKQEIALQYLKEHQNVFSKLPKNLQSEYLKQNPEFITQLTDFQKMDFIFEDKKYEFIKYLSKEQQLKFLTTNINDKNIKPKFFADKLQYFDEGVLFKAIIMHKQILDNGIKELSSTEEIEQVINSKDFYSNLKIENLPEDTQIKMALIDNRIVKKMSDEAIIKYVNNNPLLIDKLSKDKKKMLIERNPQLISMIKSSDLKLDMPDLEKKFEKYINYSDKNFQYNQYNGLDYNKVLKIATLGNDNYYYLSSITNSVRDKELLWEIAKVIPQALATTGINNNISVVKKRNLIIELFNKKISNPKILDAIKSSKIFNSFDYDDRILEANICKVLTDEKILQIANQSKIEEFIKNPSMDLMKELIIEAYGENAKKVLDSRPGLTMDNIPNLKIFDNIIFENFGEGTVHNQLSYNTKFSILLADFVNHPEKIAEYKKFERLTEGLFIENVAGNEEKYKSFIEFSDLIYSLDEKDMTPERIKALKLAISDRKQPETKLIPLKNIEDLDSYISNRNKIYDDAMQKVEDINTLREIISKRFFGMPYENNNDENYRASTLSLKGMIDYYTIDNLLKDKRTYESDLFNKDELDAMQLARIVSKVRDVKVIKEIYSALSNRDNIIGPVEFEIIKQKIPLQYSRELVSQLLKPEDAIKRAESNEEGISIEHGEDGVDVIKLNGADFKLMVHSIMDLVGEKTNSGLYLPRNVSPDEFWKYFEEGCSTISNCLIEPSVLKILPAKINFGFANIDPRLIIGMSHHDAHVSHLKRAPDPDFEYKSVKMNYPEELLRRTAAQITGQESKDGSHEYNEVTTYRYEQNPDNITSENIGGKIMPDYIVVFGKSTELHRKLAISLSKNNKPIPILEIDEKAYEMKKSIYMRAGEYDEEHKVTPKEDSKIVQDVKKIIDENQLEK